MHGLCTHRGHRQRPQGATREGTEALYASLLSGDIAENYPKAGLTPERFGAAFHATMESFTSEQANDSGDINGHPRRGRVEGSPEPGSDTFEWSAVKCCSMPGLKRKCRHCKTVCTWLKAIDHDLDMLQTTGEDAVRLDRLSALAAEMEGYQLLKTTNLFHKVKIQISAPAQSP
ncbi:TPA: hypothetical protein ACH3X1_005452 [Trebouxia sp. C0004]